MLDSKFTFSKRAEQVNQARFGASLTYVPGAGGTGSQLTIRKIAGAASGIEGVTQSNYTDAASNNANITLETSISAGAYNMTAYANHSAGALFSTNPGPPVPSVLYDAPAGDYANHTYEFHGTCKPATFGDYVNHTSVDSMRGVGSGFDNYFVTAGYDPTGAGAIGINVINIAMASTISITPSVVASIASGFPTNSINTNNQLRLFTHPDWVDPNGPPNSNVLLIGWDNASNIFLERYMWDGNNITIQTNGNLGGTTNNMFYTGQHDIHYLNSGNILLQTWNSSHTAGLLFEIDGFNLAVVTSKSTNFVAYDPATDTILIQSGTGVATWNNTAGTGGKTTLNTSVNSSQGGVFGSATNPFDAVYHPDEPLTIYIGEETPGNSLTGHRFTYNGGGAINGSSSFSQSFTSNNGAPFRQIERTSPDVLMNSVGPGYSSVPPVRSACSNATHRAVSPAINYTDPISSYFYEDITQMRHPKSQDYTLSADTSTDSTIKGNDHLIASTYDAYVACFGQNYCKKHWEQYNTTGGISSHYTYILYLGYYYDQNSNMDGYAYIVVSGLNGTFSLNNLTTSPPGSELLHWVNFRNT